jgi:tRNA pseudouridine13 synthase
LRTVSYAGLKDRQALTRQWFSVQLPGKADPDLSAAENDTLKILKTTRHKRKLQRGAHSANGFTLRLTQLAATRPPSSAPATDRQQGIPNYFGAQRFGHDGGNVVDARDWAARKALPEQRNVRSRLLSTRAAFCSIRCWRRVSPMAPGSVRRSATCWHSPTAAVFPGR